MSLLSNMLQGMGTLEVLLILVTYAGAVATIAWLVRTSNPENCPHCGRTLR